MMERWRKNRRRLLSLAAAGAVGAASAYAVYKWWWSGSEGVAEGEGLEEDPGGGAAAGGSGGDQASGSGRRPGGSSGVLLEPRGPAGTAQLDAEAHLQHHFDSIQDIADTTTLPSLLPALSRALMAAADVEAPLERLRRAKEGSAPLAPADKLAAWEELKVAAFARAAGGAWLLPALDAFVRVQLNILGRHLYLESAVENSGMQRPGGVPRLSAPSQERFLSYAEHLAQQGAARLLAEVRAAAQAELGGVALAEAVSPEAAAALLRRVSAAFAAAAARGPRGWAAYLLPGPAGIREGLAPAGPDNRAVLLGAEEMLVDAGVVEAMAAEAEAVAAGPEFAAALQAGADEVLRVACARLAAGMGAAPLPLAKAVPLVAGLGGELLSPAGRPPLARLAPVRSLSARVYGCCFCGGGA